MQSNLSDKPVKYRAEWRVLAGILLVALAARLALFAVAWQHSPDLTAMHFGGANDYLEPAKSLIEHGEFSRDGAPELLRTPGYPLLLTPGIALRHVEAVTFALQMLLSLITVGVAFRLTRSLTASRPAAIFAGLLLALEPLSVIYTSYLATETSFTCLIVLMIAALAGYNRSGSLAQLALAAALLAAASLVRPITYYLPPVIALALLARGLWQMESKLRGALAALLFLVVSVAPTAAWQARNWAVAGYSGFAAISDWNLYFFQGASVLAHQKHQSFQVANAELKAQWEDRDHGIYQSHPELRGASQAEVFRFMHREGSRLVRENLPVYLKLHLQGMVRLLTNPGAFDLLSLTGGYPEEERTHPVDAGVLAIVRQMHHEAPGVLYSNLLLAVVPAIAFLTAALGLLCGLRRLNWGLLLLVLVAAYLTTLAGGPAAMARLRHPIMPLLCVLAGFGVAELSRLWARYRTSRDPKPVSEPGANPLRQAA